MKAAVADRRWFEEKIRDLWASTVHVFVSVCARMCTVHVRARLCVCGAFIHVPPVTFSPAWTTNTGMFEVRLTRACVGCHILSLLSQMNWEGWGWWGLGVGLGRESRESCLFLSLPLSQWLSHSFSYSDHGGAGGVGEEKDATLLHRLCVGSLGSAYWLIRLWTTFELHCSWDWQQFPPRRQFEHTNIKQAAWNLQTESH